MSQISEESATAFAKGEAFHRGSTKVRICDSFVGLWLENKQLARRSPHSGHFTISLCETQSAAVRARLCAVLSASYRAGLCDHSLYVAQRNGVSFLRNTAPGAQGYSRPVPSDDDVSIVPLR